MARRQGKRAVITGAESGIGRGGAGRLDVVDANAGISGGLVPLLEQTVGLW